MTAQSSGEWEPVRKMRTYEQVMAQIEGRILDGSIGPGDKLPSERDFAATLGVSRPSLREALRVLEALGIVEIRPGAGADGGSVFVATPGPGIGNLLKLQLALGHFTPLDVLQTRLALETWVVGEAARHAEDRDLQSLGSVLDLMDDPAVSAREFNALDTQFHFQIAESAGNQLTAHLMSSLRTAIQRRMIEKYETLADWRATAVTVRSEHRGILEALTRRDADLAVRRVREHIVTFYDTILEPPTT